MKLINLLFLSCFVRLESLISEKYFFVKCCNDRVRLNKSTAASCRRYDEQTRGGRRFPFLCKFPYVCLKKSFFFSPHSPFPALVISDELTERALFFWQNLRINFILKYSAIRTWRYIFESILSIDSPFASRCLFIVFFILFSAFQKEKTFLQTKHTIIKYLFILMPTQRIMTTTTCTTCVCA